MKPSQIGDLVVLSENRTAIGYIAAVGFSFVCWGRAIEAGHAGLSDYPPIKNH